MRVLVTGAGGYIGGRLVPVLLERGHDVVASFSSGRPTPPKRGAPATGPWWADRVDSVGMDVLDEAQVRDALQDVDAAVYLVHSLADKEFAERDRRGATVFARAAAAAGVRRIVYLSGLVPDVAESRLSPHLASRLEVERILTASGVPTVTARAAIVVGSGSTSFEIVRHVSERLPVQAIPSWMASRVQPVALVDVLEVLAAALEAPGGSRSYDVGGPDQLSYAELLHVYADVARLVRPRLPLLLPRPAVGGTAGQIAGELAGRITGVPGPTVSALLESLHHDMVCLEESFRSDLLTGDRPLLGVREAVVRSLTRPRAGVRVADRDPMGPLPTDPDWAGGSVYLFDGAVRHRPRGPIDRLLLGLPRPW
jgi:uncharacterized protein YbjT (DUF2867 family)